MKIVSLQKFRVGKVNQKLGNLFNKEEMKLLTTDFNKFHRFTELTKFTTEEMEIIKLFPPTKYRLRQFVLVPFNETSELKSLALFKNSLPFFYCCFESRDFSWGSVAENSLKNSLVVEVTVNGSLVWLGVGGRNLINLCGANLVDFLNFFRSLE
jgi:hypothetical protein